MMKILLPLISFLLGTGKTFFKEPGVALTQQLVLHLRALTTMLVSTIVSLVLFCVGTSFLVSALAKQLDSEDSLVFSGGITLFSTLTVVSLAVLIYSLRRQTWLKTLGFEERAPVKQSGALENAVALLVMDFVEERQNKRTQKSKQAS